MSPLALLVCITTIAAGAGATILSEPTGIDELARTFLEWDDATWTDLSSGGDNGEDNKTSDDVARLVLSRYIEFSELREQLVDVPRDVTDEEWLRALKDDLNWKQAYAELRQVRPAYEQWKRVIAADGVTAKQQWLQFAQSALNKAGSTPLLKDGRTLDKVLDALARQVTEHNLFNNALQKAEMERGACRLQTSVNRVLYELYETVALAQLDGYVMQQWSRALLAMENRCGEAFAAAVARARYEKERAETRRLAKVALGKSDRSLWRCDPTHGHSAANYTYDQLTQLLQGYIENEKNMNPRGNCMQTCAYYDYTTNMGCYDGYCNRQKPRQCHGKLHECQFVKSDMTICEADQNSNRRYEYIKYDKSHTLGRNTGCPNERNARVKSWWRWLFWHCSYCMCLCDDETNPQTDRFWSLRPSLSDSAHDMVVTGVRLVKVERVIHLQIQQARLGKRGRVDVRIAVWRPIEPFYINSTNTKNGHDYHTMSYKKCGIDLDDVTVPTGHVVTGVKWRLVGAHLNLEVLSTPVDWAAGKLIRPQDKSYWVSSDSTLARKKLELRQPDIPTRQLQPSRVDSEPNMYVEFTHTDMEKDAGQTTVPFLDTQRVTSEPPAPLSGIGLYHKGQPGYGGYVAPKVITYDYTPHMRD